MSARARMPLGDALRVIHAARRETDVVVTTMAAAREWMTLEPHPLDFVLVPSSMGQATSFALGIALAQPDRRVIVINGDGSLLMNLGTLVTITAAGAPNLAVVLVDNGAYDVTGAQPTPGSPAGRADGVAVDFAAMARACGFPSVHHFADADAWVGACDAVLGTPGPTFVTLDVASEPGVPGPRSPGVAWVRAQRLREALVDG
jgi:sulfopyruvate decarboxylase subunit beta